jgi:hypothetical protein
MSRDTPPTTTHTTCMYLYRESTPAPLTRTSSYIHYCGCVSHELEFPLQQITSFLSHTIPTFLQRKPHCTLTPSRLGSQPSSAALQCTYSDICMLSGPPFIHPASYRVQISPKNNHSVKTYTLLSPPSHNNSFHTSTSLEDTQYIIFLHSIAAPTTCVCLPPPLPHRATKQIKTFIPPYPLNPPTMPPRMQNTHPCCSPPYYYTNRSLSTSLLPHTHNNN